VRAAVAEAELLAERVELERLVLALPPPAPASPAGLAQDGAALLALYCRVAGIRADGPDRGHLAQLLAAAFPEAVGEAAVHVDDAFGA
jgi:hypothetical protein